jgi:hypothetical protein
LALVVAAGLAWAEGEVLKWASEEHQVLPAGLTQA